MSNVRILAVDDAPLIRNVVSELFAQEDGFEIVGSAANGREALARIHLLDPDIVILDVEMPVLDGWSALHAIQLSYPRLAVIVFSSFGQSRQATADKAISLGARDFVPKPANVTDQQAAWQELRDTLLASVKLHSQSSAR